MKTAFLSLLLPAWLLATVQAERAAEPALKIRAFDLNEVRLLESPFKQAQENTRRLLLETNTDQLLYPFRREAGIASPIKGSDSYAYPHTGHLLGHYLSACAQLYRNTGDAQIKAKADAVVAALSECQQKLGDGYLAGFPQRAIRHLYGLEKDPAAKAAVPWYCLHKVYAGLLDMYLLTANQQAFDVLSKALEWVDRSLGQLSEPQVQAMLGTEHGGMNELLANAYAASGEQKFLQLSLRFNHRKVMEPFSSGQNPLDGLHANTQIPKFVGVARQYLLTGDPLAQRTAHAFWEAVMRDRSYVTGGNSIGEYFPPKGHLSHFAIGWTTESCNEYNMLKLTRTLFAADPQPAYVDFFERTLYNHILSSRHPETAGQLYFQLLQSGHSKGEAPGMAGWRFPFNQGIDAQKNGPESSCCSGSGLESNTKYAESIYFHQGEKELFVNLFIPSALEWKSNGLTLTQQTRYPQEGSTKLKFTCRQPLALKLQIRRPAWATNLFEIFVNGRKQESVSAPGSYVQVERTWADGDVLEVVMPMSLHTEAFGDNPNRLAIMFGPLVMAGITELGNPFSVIRASGQQFLQALRPVNGKLLEFTAPAELFRTSPIKVGEGPKVFRPLYSVFGEAYAIYWDLVAPREFDTRAAAMDSELQRLVKLDARTVDVVLFEGLRATPLAKGAMHTFQSHFLSKWQPRPAKEISEQAHELKATELKTNPKGFDEVYHAEMDFGLFGDFRRLEPGNRVDYRMKVLPETEQQLELRLWKSKVPVEIGCPKQGVIELLVGGELLGSCDVEALPAGQFSSKVVSIPKALMAGKQSVEVTLRVPEKSAPVFGLYECRVLSRNNAVGETK